MEVRAVCQGCGETARPSVELQPTPDDPAGVRTALKREKCSRCGKKKLTWNVGDGFT